MRHGVHPVRPRRATARPVAREALLLAPSAVRSPAGHRPWRCSAVTFNVRSRLEKLEALYGGQKCQCNSARRPDVLVLEEITGPPTSETQPFSDDDARAWAYTC